MLGLGRRQRCRRYRDLSLENIQALFSGVRVPAAPAAGCEFGTPSSPIQSTID